MSSTRLVAPRATLITIICALAALTVFPAAASAASSTPKARSACANKLCTKDRASAPSCWRHKQRARVARCFIRRAAEHYGQPAGYAMSVAYRESRYNWRVTNRSSGAAGLFQFMPRTWAYTPYRNKSAYHPRWAALAAMWMWKKGYQSHWSTY